MKGRPKVSKFLVKARQDRQLRAEVASMGYDPTSASEVLCRMALARLGGKCVRLRKMAGQ